MSECSAIKRKRHKSGGKEEDRSEGSDRKPATIIKDDFGRTKEGKKGQRCHGLRARVSMDRESLGRRTDGTIGGQGVWQPAARILGIKRWQGKDKRNLGKMEGAGGDFCTIQTRPRFKKRWVIW